jgi:hypothetical protein
MRSSEQYRRNAIDCLRISENTSDADSRAALLELARAWQLLAEQADRNSRTDVVYETPPDPKKQPVVLQQQQIQPDSSD